MNNFKNNGTTLPHTNASGSTISAGSIVRLTHTLGVAVEDIADGATGTVAIQGTFSGIPKVAAAVFAVGEKLIWDISANTNTGAFDDSSATPATGDLTGAAVAAVAGAADETTCTVTLTPGNVTKT